MFKNIRYQIATYYAKRASQEISKGDFEAVRKALKYFKKSISIVPPSKELSDLGRKMREDIEAYERKHLEELGR